MPTFSPTSTVLTNRNKFEFPEMTMRIFARRLHPGNLSATPRTFATTCAFNQHVSDTEQTPYWRSLGPWKDVHADDFLNYGWQVRCLNDSLSTKTRLTFGIRGQTPSSGQISSWDSWIRSCPRAYRITDTQDVNLSRPAKPSSLMWKQA